MFNENKSCIEITFFIRWQLLKDMFNENKSCIEILEKMIGKHLWSLFNENKSCIEISKNLIYLTTISCLMRTRVVLKYMTHEEAIEHLFV